MHPKYWAIFLLATVAICAGAIYYEKQPATHGGLADGAIVIEPVIAHHVPKPIPTPPPSIASSTAVDTSRWQTHTDTENGYEINYPNSLYNVSNPNNPQSFQLQSTSKPLVLGGVLPDQFANKTEGVDYMTNGFQIEIHSEAATTTAQDIKGFDSQDLTVSDGVKATYYYVTDGIPDDFIVIKNPNNPTSNIIFSYAIQCEDKTVCTYDSSQTLIYQVLNTFQFASTTTSQTDTSGLQTYTNSQYGFSFEYPSDYKLTEKNDPQAGFYIEITTPQTEALINETGGENEDTIIIVPSTANPGYFSGGILPNPIEFKQSYFESKSVSDYSNEYLGQLIIDGRTAYQLKHSEESTEKYTILQNTDGSFFTIQQSYIASVNQGDNGMEAYDNLVSTFKFTN